MRQKRIGYVLFFETEQIEARCYCETLNLCENLFASYLVFWDTGGTFPTKPVDSVFHVLLLATQT